MSSFNMCSSQYGVNGVKSVSVVFPAAKTAFLVDEAALEGPIERSFMSSIMASISAALDALPSDKAAFALLSQDMFVSVRTR